MTATPTLDALVAEIAALRAAQGSGLAPIPASDPVPVPASAGPRILRVAFNWGAPGNMVADTVNLGGMEIGTLLRATFVSPATGTYWVRCNVAEYPGGFANYVGRHIRVGTTPTGGDVADVDVPSTGGTVFQVVPATMYYVTVWNRDPAKVGNFRLELQKLPG